MFIFCLLPNEGDSNKQVKISVKFKKNVMMQTNQIYMSQEGGGRRGK